MTDRRWDTERQEWVWPEDDAVEAKISRLRAVLEAARLPHYINVEDCWYSCPLSGECCNGGAESGKCDCGADEHNAKIDEALRDE